MLINMFFCICYRKTQVGFSAIEPVRKRSEIPRCEYAKSRFSGRLSGNFLDVSMVTTVRFHSIYHMTQKSFPSVSGTAKCFNAFNLNVPHFLSVSISLLIFCLSPSLSLLSVCLHLYLYFLSVSISIFIFCLSPS